MRACSAWGVARGTCGATRTPRSTPACCAMRQARSSRRPTCQITARCAHRVRVCALIRAPNLPQYLQHVRARRVRLNVVFACTCPGWYILRKLLCAHLQTSRCVSGLPKMRHTSTSLHTSEQAVLGLPEMRRLGVARCIGGARVLCRCVCRAL